MTALIAVLGRPERYRAVTLSLLAVALVALACGRPADAASDIILASTTSLDDSGLLDALLPAFRREHPHVRVRLVAVGTGQALALGRRGDADVLLVHAEEDEARFMASGAGRVRLPFMRSAFVLVGPPHDPAGAAAAADAAGAMRAVARAGAAFVSRGDSSGTHHRELQLWHAAGVPEQRVRQLVADAGQGMAETLTIASERGAYTLTDVATFTALSPVLALRILHTGDSALVNVYSVIIVANARNPEGADTFARWLTADDAARIITTFGMERSGRPLFEPVHRAGAPR